MQNKVLIFIFFAGSIFLFAPMDKAKADDYSCENFKNNRCKNLSTHDPDMNIAIQECRTTCTTELGGATIQDCITNNRFCIPPKAWSCRNYDQCTVITEKDNQGGVARAYQKCSDICGVPVDLNNSKNGGCQFSTDPCPLPSDAPGGPLAGATVEALKKAASSDLNKAKFKTPTDLINRVIQLMMAFIGSIALVLYIVSGFIWMTASGNAERVTKAKSTMVWTTLGVVMMLASYMLASFIFKYLGV